MEGKDVLVEERGVEVEGWQMGWRCGGRGSLWKDLVENVQEYGTSSGLLGRQKVAMKILSMLTSQLLALPTHL